jgi:hypothetical protein
MKLSKLHLIVYGLLGIIAMLIGALISQYQTYQYKLAWWKQASRKCLAISQTQDKVIKGLLR